MNILITKLVGIELYRDFEKSGVIVYYNSPKLEDFFPVQKPFQVNHVLLQQCDHFSFFEGRGRKAKILSRLPDKENMVHIIISSCDYVDTVSEFITDYFSRSKKVNSFNIYDIDYVEEAYELQDKSLFVKDYFLQIRGPKRKPRIQKPDRIRDELT